MGEKQDRGWSRPGVILGTATFVIVFATFWLTFAIGYTGSPGFRAWVDSTAATVGPLRAKVVSVSLSSLLAVVAGLITLLESRVRRRVVGALALPGVLLQRVWAAVRGRVRGWYANVVWVLSKPVRDELAVRFVEHHRSGTGEHAECRAKVRNLKTDAAQVLHYLLVQYADHSGPLVVPVDEPEMAMSLLKNVRRDRLKSACRQLETDGFLAGVKWEKRGGGEEMQVIVGNCVMKPTAARRVAGWVDEEMHGRGVWGAY